MKLEDIKKIGIAGAGTMGSGIAQIFARKGYEVVVTDIKEEFLENSKRLVNIFNSSLIEEGLMKACDTGGSIGHPESNIFYMPTKGYNVWEDEGTDGQYSRHKGRYLQFVRFYLGALAEEHGEGDSDIKKWINPTMMDVIRNVESMKMYSEWLERNEKALEEMINLDDFYKAPKVEFTEEEISWIKSKVYYRSPGTFSQCGRR